ncbi:Pentatricopeptide repeat-containing protein [Thalictrum thalictroides]|uniref:Pentatricopeptide repeat-containing protein n=1 Tax=Thalictrum thalictroides TaxID=46969 RepID=A0A7J6WN07_THATH|nr:Pentatricopeptide repeat-containing protein [Thalictrum thalictroides]
MIISGYINDTFAASRLLKFSTDPYFIPMMRAYLQRSSAQVTLGLYRVMLEKNVQFDNYTYPILVQACSARLSGFEGKEIHTHALKLGFGEDVYVVNTLVNMYSVCGNIGDVEEAVSVFDQIPEKNTIASNSMIVLFGKMGRVNDAHRLFDGMVIRDMVTNYLVMSITKCLKKLL